MPPEDGWAIPQTIEQAISELEKAVAVAPHEQTEFQAKKREILRSLIWAALVDAEARGEERGGTE